MMGVGVLMQADEVPFSMFTHTQWLVIRESTRGTADRVPDDRKTNKVSAIVAPKLFHSRTDPSVSTRVSQLQKGRRFNGSFNLQGVWK